MSIFRELKEKHHQQQTTTTNYNRTENAMANKHSTACFRPVPSIHRIVLSKSSKLFLFQSMTSKPTY
jgi:hypothetical protein